MSISADKMSTAPKWMTMGTTKPRMAVLSSAGTSRAPKEKARKIRPTSAAAATLVGLIFLAFSLGARLVPAEDNTAMRGFVVPIVIHFGAVLILSALMLIPVYTSQ